MNLNKHISFSDKVINCSFEVHLGLHLVTLINSINHLLFL